MRASKTCNFLSGAFILPNPNLFSKQMMSHARSAWWLRIKSYAPRKPRHCLASLGNPKKKKCSLLFGFRGGGSFLKWKGHFSFWGSAFQVFRQVAGLQFALGFGKTIFWEKDLAKPRRTLPPTERGLGNGMRAGFSFAMAGLAKGLGDLYLS